MVPRLLLILAPIAVIAAFFALRRKLAARAGFSSAAFPPSGASATGEVITQSFTSLTATKSVDMTIKCGCGAVHHFHSGGTGAVPGATPLPEGDTFTCPQCGKAIDLTQARKLLGRAGASV